MSEVTRKRPCLLWAVGNGASSVISTSLHPSECEDEHVSTMVADFAPFSSRFLDIFADEDWPASRYAS